MPSPKLNHTEAYFGKKNPNEVEWEYKTYREKQKKRKVTREKSC